MKMIFKIEEYLPETKQVVIRYCRKNSPKPITEYPAKAVSTHNYDVSFDSQNLVESIAQYGYEKVLRQIMLVKLFAWKEKTQKKWNAQEK